MLVDAINHRKRAARMTVAVTPSVAGTQHMVYNWTDDIDTARSMALSRAEKAAELSGDDPLILAVLGAVHTFLRNYGTARIMLERDVALDPNAAWACSRLGWVTIPTIPTGRSSISSAPCV
jgi:hypothetical protein